MLLKTILMILYSNAKINIGLNILSKRADGYHNISSIFYPVFDCFDIIEIIESDNFLFTTSGIEIPGKNNLCKDAYNTLKLLHNIPPVHIHLHKMIPIGSGLGGGSSNASFVLKGLNEMFNLKLSSKNLEKISLGIGADCPFFIDNEPKIVSGIGEIMNKIDLDLSNYSIRLFHSNIHISTIDTFSNIDLDSQIQNLNQSINLNVESWKGRIKNDFEKYIFRKHSQLEKAKERFYSDGALYASMTGTGSTIYGIFNK